jgi:hypothetical protein
MNLIDVYNTFLGCAAALALGAVLRLAVDSIWGPISRERQRKVSIQAFEDRLSKAETLKGRTPPSQPFH